MGQMSALVAAINKLILAYRGLVVHVPSVPYPDHPQAVAIGMEAAERLARYIGGDKLYVPVQAANARRTRDAVIRVQHRGGIALKKLAQNHRLCERQIRTILATASNKTEATL